MRPRFQGLSLLVLLLLLWGCSPAPSDPTQAATAAPQTIPAETAPPETAPPETRPDPMVSLLDTMTLEQKVGQMFLARCHVEYAPELATQYKLGGYLLFARDFEDRSHEQVADTIAGYQSAVSIPMFIAVDEEGGTVNRVSRNPLLRPEPFASPQDLYQQGGLERIVEDTKEKCSLLSGLGINLNLAPVCDLSQDPDDFIYDRSFGQDARHTASYVREVVQTMTRSRMGCALKHFPGYGGNVDTHTGIAYDHRPYETFRSEDFLPFRAGIESGAGMVLVSHNVVVCMDDRLPASLSPEVHRVLREELGFGGVILTDDLVMDGAGEFGSAEEIAVLAVQAGNDLLCSSEFELQIPAVLDAVRSGKIPMEQIDQAVLRILRLKQSLGLAVTPAHG